MELAPRYCRTCGSRILVKNVCHNCNNDPLKGDNYCYDCGALTPNADSCLKCGARYKINSPVKLLLTVGGLLIITIAVAGYFLSGPDSSLPSQQDTSPARVIPSDPDTNHQQLSENRDTIINNPVDTSAVIPTKPADTTIHKTAQDTTKKVASSIFTPEERRAYPVKCSYFRKNQRSQVLFFIAGGSGYIKMNDKIIELKRKSKGIDVAVFGNGSYDAIIRINGLSGSDKEWLASCTLVIKDHLQHTSATYKVYSACIEL